MRDNLDATVRRNKINSITASTLKTVTYLFSTGTLVQTLLATLGYGSALIYVSSTVLQAANVLSVILFARWTEGGGIIKRSAYVCLPIGLLFLLMIPFCIAASASIGAYIFLLLIGAMQQVGYGLQSVCEYKLPYYVYRADEYGRVLSISGIISSVISLGASALITSLVAEYSFLTIMAVSFAVSALFMALSCIFTLLEKSLIEESHTAEVQDKKEEKKMALLELFRYPVFTRLLPANFLRGIVCGVTSVLATVALELGYDEGMTTLMVTVQSLASLLACGVFAAISTRIPARLAIAVGSVMVSAVPFMLIDNSAVFIAAYGVVFIGRTLVDYGVPSDLLKKVPLDIAGPYHAWRMVLHNGGALIGTFVATFLSPMALLLAAAVLQLVSGVGFCLYKSKSS